MTVRRFLESLGFTFYQTPRRHLVMLADVLLLPFGATMAEIFLFTFLADKFNIPPPSPPRFFAWLGVAYFIQVCVFYICLDLTPKPPPEEK